MNKRDTLTHFNSIKVQLKHYNNDFDAFFKHISIP